MKPAQAIEIHRQVTYKNQLAVELLANEDELSLQQILSCFENGAVWLETSGKPQRLYNPDTPLKPGHKIHCYCNSTTLTPCPFSPELVADYEGFSIWNKPSGMLCQGSKWGDHWALYRWIRQNHWPDRASFITHRLDRFTSGLVIVAHTQDCNKKFHRLFEQRLIRKTYRAIVSGLMPEGTEHMLDTDIEQKNARSLIQVIEQHQQNKQTLVSIKPETGRKHQIRIHLSGAGYPVINDRQYGPPPFSGNLMLQACALEFINPVNNSPVMISLNPEQLMSFRSNKHPAINL